MSGFLTKWRFFLLLHSTLGNPMRIAQTVRVLVCTNDQPWDTTVYASMLQALPAQVYWEISALQKWEDRQASILGKCLLYYGLSSLYERPSLIQTLKRDEYQRPFISGNIEFNITHTQGIVACALQQGGRLGLDIEVVTPLNIEEHAMVFTDQERLSILNNPNSLQEFFNLWTRKEAAIKADGRGFSLNPLSVDVRFPSVQIEHSHFNFHTIELPEPFIGHLATTHVGSIELKWVDFEVLFQAVVSSTRYLNPQT